MNQEVHSSKLSGGMEAKSNLFIPEIARQYRFAPGLSPDSHPMFCTMQNTKYFICIKVANFGIVLVVVLKFGYGHLKENKLQQSWQQGPLDSDTQRKEIHLALNQQCWIYREVSLPTHNYITNLKANPSKVLEQ